MSEKTTKLKSAPKSILIIRNAIISDIPQINEVVEETYPAMPSYTKEMLRDRLPIFPMGSLWLC